MPRPDRLKALLPGDPLLEKVVEKFSLSVTDEMLSLIDHPEDPIAKQFLPSEKELHLTKEELADPIGDDRKSPIKGIVHRYPDRCLLMPITVCPVYCRFCFRREKVSSNTNSLNKKELDAALDYIAENPGIWEVILTGGDPLFIRPKLLRRIMGRLEAIEHVDVVRFHTRVPLVTPALINRELIEAISIDKAVWIVLHSNHPKEFTERGRDAIAGLIDHGIPMLSQSVLLKGVNDNEDVLEELFRTMIVNRIKPYYLHQGDFAKGTSHFRTTIEKGQRLMKYLKEKVSGLCQPSYVLDIPGGHGKVPIQHCYLHRKEEGYSVEDPQGNIHPYP